MRKLFLLGTSITLAAMAACSSENGSDGGGGGQGGGGGSGPNVCDTDYARIKADSTPVSFENEVMPIFANSCVQSQCHCLKEYQTDALKCTTPQPKAGLFLGSNEMMNEQIVQRVLDNLVDVASKTAPAVLRVASGDPENSFLVQKISDTHADQGHACTPQDTRATGCGTEMPVGATLCTQNNGQERFETIARWVAQVQPARDN